MKVQLFTPVGVQISSAGNFSATVFNIGYFENKINRWLGQSGKKKFWSDWADADGRVDVDGFRTDMMELLKTHYENDKSKKFPEGMKKEKLYSFLGVKPEDLSSKDWNRAAKDFKLFISLRFDRIRMSLVAWVTTSRSTTTRRSRGSCQQQQNLAPRRTS